MDARMMTELEEAWRELDDDPAVRVIVNAGEGKNFQTGLDVAALSRDKAAMTEQSRRTRDAELRFTAWHNQVWKPVIAAVHGSCAGGGLHFVADADIVIAASDATLLRHPRVARAGDVVRGRRPVAQDGVRADHAHGVGRALRAHARGAGASSSAWCRRSSTRPSSCATRRSCSPRRSPGTRPRRCGPPSARCGARSSSASPTPAAPAVRSWSGMWGHPDQEEGPLAFSEKRDAQWMEIT